MQSNISGMFGAQSVFLVLDGTNNQIALQGGSLQSGSPSPRQPTPPKLPNLPKLKSSEENAWGSSGKDARFLSKLRRLLGRTEEDNRKLILYMAQKMASR
jgi:hypothetical protein